MIDELNIQTNICYRFLGADKESTKFGVGFIEKTDLKKNQELNITHDNCSLVYLLEGSGFYSDESGYKRDLKAGSFFIRTPRLMHTIEINKSHRWLEAYLDIGKLLWEPMLKMNLFSSVEKVGYIDIRPLLIKKLWNMVEKLREAGREELKTFYLKIVEEFCYIQSLSISEKLDNREKKVIDEACEFLENNFMLDLNLPDYCKKKGIGYEYFRKLFTKEIGSSPLQYRVQKRIEKACNLLLDCNYSIGLISDTLKYSSQYEFSAQFKKYMGVSPKKFRDESFVK